MLNVGLSAGILDTRTFSMFVLHALVLTFMTTPLTILFYPPKFRVHVGEQPKQLLPATSAEEGAGATRREIQDALKTRFAVIVDRIEQLPAVMTITQLLQIPFFALPAAPSSDASSAEMDEKAAMSEGVPALSPTRSSAERPRIVVDVLRLIELTNRAAAVLKSQAADALAQPVEHRHGLLPGDARICELKGMSGPDLEGRTDGSGARTCHGHAVLEAGGAVDGDVLAAFDQVRLDHDAHDHRRGVAGLQLTGLRMRTYAVRK